MKNLPAPFFQGGEYKSVTDWPGLFPKQYPEFFLFMSNKKAQKNYYLTEAQSARLSALDEGGHPSH